MYKKSSKLE